MERTRFVTEQKQTDRHTDRLTDRQLEKQYVSLGGGVCVCVCGGGGAVGDIIIRLVYDSIQTGRRPDCCRESIPL